MLSYRLGSEVTGHDVLAGLNIYADRPRAFDQSAVEVGLLLATHAAAVVAAHTNQERADNLARALETSRGIGVAIGVLMAHHKLTQEQAFDLLRIASQNTNRKIRDIAEEVALTGELPFPTNER
jgi:AmiR/NasT family two-component response regulator